ncbi:MAG: GFA family protein [Gammaproteobacteria bacterium]|nr:GFA family protein [Gammaproteobacteria bacterium]NIP90354.1 GFA family protein [Gammaproteobacteria bacterium]NIR22281.1 GFA family protein [Gammaproteobacteria bacterium]NIS03919.1 GFA family protein [Gammaproteobacteria bacterium]NIU42362.1 GFA family protein [Gammaproteobacteria bacterium]
MTGNSESEKVSGGCLCGAVRYELEPPLRPVVACHCLRCRRATGHYVSATAVPRERFHLIESDALKWYRSSPHAERGFCGVCGSNLFWSAHGRDTISIMAGSIDGETGLRTVAHICVAQKGDYYDLNPSEPQYQAGDYPSPWSS